MADYESGEEFESAESETELTDKVKNPCSFDDSQ